MKFYNFETRFVSMRDALREYLQENGVYYELSGGPGFYHFEIKTDAAEAEEINRFIESVSIVEVST